MQKEARNHGKGPRDGVALVERLLPGYKPNCQMIRCDPSSFGTMLDRPMKKRDHTAGEPQWHWKITLTVLSAIVGAILALYLFRVL
jgi:hypothetical protein